MMGTRLDDPARIDGPVASWPGLGVLDAETQFLPEKTLALTRATSAWPVPGHALEGYEIHHGRTTGTGIALAREAGAALGLVGERAVGTYLHGLLRNDPWRAGFLARVREHRGLPPRGATVFDPLEARIDRWARHVRAALRPGAWERIRAPIGYGPTNPTCK